MYNDAGGSTIVLYKGVTPMSFAKVFFAFCAVCVLCAGVLHAQPADFRLVSIHDMLGGDSVSYALNVTSDNTVMGVYVLGDVWQIFRWNEQDGAVNLGQIPMDLDNIEDPISRGPYVDVVDLTSQGDAAAINIWRYPYSYEIGLNGIGEFTEITFAGYWNSEQGVIEFFPERNLVYRSQAVSINDARYVLAQEIEPQVGSLWLNIPFLWHQDSGRMNITLPPDIPARHRVVNANNTGVVVGAYRMPCGSCGQSMTTHGALWDTQNGFTDLETPSRFDHFEARFITDNRVILGTAYNRFSDPVAYFTWRDGAYTEVPWDSRYTILTFSENLDVVTSWRNPETRSREYFYQQMPLEDSRLEIFTDDYILDESAYVGVNDNGYIAANLRVSPSDISRAVVWIPTCEPVEDGGLVVARGDTDGNGILNITDPVVLLNYLFFGDSIPCPVASNANGDCEINLSDAVYVLSFLFQGGPAPVGNPVTCRIQTVP